MKLTQPSPRPAGYLGDRHPVAEPAARRCRSLHPGASRIGGVACGPCWERAIRDDERAVVMFGVPREIEPDPDYVDEIAVERAIGGERVPLTTADESAAVSVLTARGWSDHRIGEWIGIAPSRVASLRPAVPLTEISSAA